MFFKYLRQDMQTQHKSICRLTVDSKMKIISFLVFLEPMYDLNLKKEYLNILDISENLNS